MKNAGSINSPTEGPTPEEEMTKQAKTNALYFTVSLVVSMILTQGLIYFFNVR